MVSRRLVNDFIECRCILQSADEIETFPAIACRNHLGACTPTDAVAVCGHASFCQDSSCVCKAPKTFTGTVEWKPPADAATAKTDEAGECRVRRL